MLPEAVWRVYKPEWLVAYISDELEAKGEAECRERFHQKYEGRVLDKDWCISAMGVRKPGRRHLQLRLPNLKGEFRCLPDAEHLQAGLGRHASLVVRGSPEERELLAYGKRRLPRPG